MRALILSLACCVFATAAHAQNQVSITEDGAYRIIRSNGIPNHGTGSFPNAGNPNPISEQNHKYRVPLKPQKTGRAKAQDGVVGVAINGVPFEPGTAECYGQKRGSRPDSNCAWREEAIVNGKGRLGLDHNNAHVQPNGTYHYHGIPKGMSSYYRGKGPYLLLGYAADGFPMVVTRGKDYKPSWRLKSGTRPSGPGGRYDGTYTQDFEYVAGSGDLDECNGAEIEGQYVYVLAKSFPYIPRCLMGTADASFARRSPGAGNASQHRRKPPPHGHRHPPPHRR